MVPQSEPGWRSLPPPPPDTEELGHLLTRLSEQDGETNILETIERLLIQVALQQAGGNQRQAARMLGVDRKQIARRVKKTE